MFWSVKSEHICYVYLKTGNGNGNRAGVASITTGQNSVDGGGGPVLFEEHHNNCVKVEYSFWVHYGRLQIMIAKKTHFVRR